MTTPTFGAWEHWNGDQLQIVPLRYRPGEAWALISGSWQQVDSAEAAMSAMLLEEDVYRALFPPMAALPATAFQD
jgi:hypothetical protein